jgi:hypothetical protein
MSRVAALYARNMFDGVGPLLANLWTS